MSEEKLQIAGPGENDGQQQVGTGCSFVFGCLRLTVLRQLLAAAAGGTYCFIAQFGVKDALTSVPSIGVNNIYLKVMLGVLTSYTGIMYYAFSLLILGKVTNDGLRIGPKSSFAVFAAVSFFNPTLRGAQALSFQPAAALAFAFVSFGIRALFCSIGFTALSSNIEGLRSDWRKAVHNRNIEMLVLLVCNLCFTLTFCASALDNKMAAFVALFHAFNLADELNKLLAITMAILGACFLVPLIFDVNSRGMRAIVEHFQPRCQNRSEFIHWLLPVVMALLVTLGPLGSIAAGQQQTLSQFGLIAFVMRFAAALWFSACAGFPAARVLIDMAKEQYCSSEPEDHERLSTDHVSLQP